MVHRRVLCCIEQSHCPAVLKFCQLSQALLFFEIVGHLFFISQFKFRKAIFMTVVPLSKRTAWRDVLHPVVKSSSFPGHSPRPEPVNKNTLSVFRRPSIIDAFDLYYRHQLPLFIETQQKDRTYPDNRQARRFRIYHLWVE